MAHLIDWFKANKLSLNFSKSVLLRFWRDDNEPSENLDINGLYIPEVDTMKFLGVYLDRNLNWDDHLTHLYNKLNSNWYLLSISKKFLSENNLVKLYYAHFYSHIKYGITVWGNMAKKSQLNNIYSIQKTCTKSICNQPKSSSILGLLKRHRLLKVEDLVELELGKFGYKLSKNLLPKPLKTLMESKGGIKSHRYPTRNKQIPNIQRHYAAVFNHSYMCRSLVICSQTPQHVHSMKSVKSLPRTFKEEKLKAYKN